jgi:hypothetical protein
MRAVDHADGLVGDWLSGVALLGHIAQMVHLFVGRGKLDYNRLLEGL